MGEEIFWSKEVTAQDGRQVFKLVDSGTRTIQGAISLSEKKDHVFIHLIESATHNRLDPRRFVNVARLLIDFAGQTSCMIPEADGFLALTPKTALINYYRSTFHAHLLPKGNVGIDDTVTSHQVKDVILHATYPHWLI